MSIDDYNRGYQGGWSGVATGPPRSAAEMAGRWNADLDRRRISQMNSPATRQADGEEGGVNGLLVLVAILGGMVGWSLRTSAVGASLGATVAVLGTIALTWLLISACRVTAWIFRPIPAFRVAGLGAAAAVGLQWALSADLGPIGLPGPVIVAIHGALAFLLVAATVRIVLAPFRAMTRRG
jgi:hypothetical protein